MSKVLLLFSIVLATASADTLLDFLPPLFENGRSATVDEVNTGFGQAINTIVQQLAGQSIPLPDIIKKHLYGNNKVLTLKLTEGLLFGADSKFIVNEGTTVSKDDTNAYITSQYGYKKLIANYNYKFKKEGVVTKGTLFAELEEFFYQIDLTFNLQTLRIDTDLSVVNEGEVAITVNGRRNDRIEQAVRNKIRDEMIKLAMDRAAALVDEYNAELEQ